MNSNSGNPNSGILTLIFNESQIWESQIWDFKRLMNPNSGILTLIFNESQIWESQIWDTTVPILGF